MAELDLDAIDAAESEAAGEPKTILLGGQKFTMPAVMPALALVGAGRLAQGRPSGLEDVLRSLFGDQVDDALAAGFKTDHLPHIWRLYGMDSGEALASAG